MRLKKKLMRILKNEGIDVKGAERITFLLCEKPETVVFLEYDTEESKDINNIKHYDFRRIVK